MSDNQGLQEFQKTKDKLDSVGCGFCLAKWTQVTIHLSAGLTHSCHHPVQHKIPLSELKRNPSALHNTQFKKEKKIRRVSMCFLIYLSIYRCTCVI